MDPVGIVAGSGRLPLHVAALALRKGHRVLAVAFPDITDAEIVSHASDVLWLKPGQLQKAITGFKSAGINRVVMAGKIEKSNLLRPWKIGLDVRAIKMIRSLKDWADDTVLAAIAGEFLKDGIVVEEITEWAQDLMAPLGVLTRRTPSSRQWQDIEFGRRMAKGIGSLDIGQTVVVKNRAVIAVEAIEGTDRTIRRVADLDIKDAVVVKMAKPEQDMRFDVPGVGPSTIESMVAVGAKVLAVETGRTMIAEREATIRDADAAKISIVGIPHDGPLQGEG